VRRYLIPALVALIVALAGVAIALAISGDEGSPQHGVTEQATTTAPTFPYDFVEAPEEVTVETLENAKFASLTLVTPDGLESYLLAADSEAFVSLTEALAGANEGPHEVTPEDMAPGEAAGSTTPSGSDALIPGVTVSTLTYVMDDRSTYTLVLDLEDGILFRGDQEWRPQADLGGLIQAATADAAP
jgi:hypothetical protein